MVEAKQSTHSAKSQTAERAMPSKAGQGLAAPRPGFKGLSSIIIQTRLAATHPGDSYEQEADGVADRVVSAYPVVGMQRVSLQNNSSPASMPAISRMPQSTASTETIANEGISYVAGEIDRRPGGGQPLPTGVSAYMGKSIGADFSDVRVHTDSRAALMSGRINAQAFTHGKDIYFNRGMYNPSAKAGIHLLAHELTHVVQQRGVQTIQRKMAAPVVSDKAHQGVLTKIIATGQQAKKHDPASKKVKEAQAAAKPPANEKQSLAQANKITEMEQQEPAPFDENKFKAALRQKISALQLNTLKEAEDFKANKRAEGLKGDAGQQVSKEKNTAADNIQHSTAAPLATAGVEGKVVGPAPTAAPGTAAPPISGEQAAPKVVGEQVVSLQEGSKQLDKQMSTAKVTETQLQSSNEPAFKNALGAKKTAQQDAISRPQQFRKDEKTLIGNAQAAMSARSTQQLNSITGTRRQQMAGVLSKQEDAKAKEEADRLKVSAEIDRRFAVTKQEVEGILATLDTDVKAIFDQGINQATKDFENYVEDEVRRYKIERYLAQPGGSILWAKDLLLGLPDEVNSIYRRGKERYVRAMDSVIDKVSSLVAKQLNAAKRRISAGKSEIKQYVASLPVSLQQIGGDAAKKIQSDFAELEQKVNTAQSELINDLSNRYQAGLSNIDKKITDMQEANKGLKDTAMVAIGEVIGIIENLKKMLLDTLSRAASAIDLIVADPIAFLGNLVAGVKQGIMAFAGNIAAHLKAGLMGWLFGTLAQAGIDMPKTFDLKGIMMLILQVLGLTYANVRSRAVNIVGEKVVAGLEKVAEVFIVIKNEGIGGLWRVIKEKIEDLKDVVISSVKEFVTQKIIVAGISWLIGLLNPAAAFIKACKMIYDVIMFFVERGKQIIDLVNAVINSVVAIAKGAISVAATAVENALAKALPVAISFLASLLGLSGISEKIKAIIARIQAPINAAIDWVIKKALALVKAAGKLLGIGGSKDPEKDKADKEERLKKGMATGKKAVSRFEGKKVGSIVLKPLLTGIKTMYRMKTLEVVKKGDAAELVGEVNPTSVEPLRFRLIDGEPELPPGLSIGERIKYVPGKDAHETRGNIYIIHSVNKDTLLVYLSSTDGYIKKPISNEDFEKQWKERYFEKYTGTGEAEKMPAAHISFRSNGLDVEEYSRQVILQERGINAMTAVHWLSHKTDFTQTGRHVKSAKAQETARNDEFAAKLYVEKIRLTNEFKKTKNAAPSADDEIIIEAQARVNAQNFMGGTAALHGPDQVAGGHHKGLTGLGSLRINSSIGSQWAKIQEGEGQQRSIELLNHVEAFMKTVKEQKDAVMMNVRLTVINNN